MISETYQLWDDREDVKLTTFLHAGSPIPEIRRKRPAVLVIPGGAYLDCLRNGAEADTIAYTFAMDGFHTFVLQYSVKTTAPEPPGIPVFCPGSFMKIQKFSNHFASCVSTLCWII